MQGSQRDASPTLKFRYLTGTRKHKRPGANVKQSRGDKKPVRDGRRQQTGLSPRHDLSS